MEKKIELKSREEIAILVDKFYARIREDAQIGHFFNEVITDWDEHLEKLTDFWESQLFFEKHFTGNPIAAHNKVDAIFDHSISMEHFGYWLRLWLDTIDTCFTGEKAEMAKHRARNMSTWLFMKIFEARK